MTGDYRRKSDELLVRLDEKVDGVVNILDEMKGWILSHEKRINDCERQHVRIKTIIGIAGTALTLFYTGALYLFTHWKANN